MVCRQLGLPTESKRSWAKNVYYYTCNTFAGVMVLYDLGRGTGPILLHYIECTGDENILSQCDYLGFGYGDCVHSGGVGVRCGEKLFVFNFPN